MAFPKGAPAAAPASGHGDPAAYRRPREGGYGGGSHHADKKHDGERKRRRHHDKDKADREARHAEKKRKTSKTVKPVEKEKKRSPKRKHLLPRKNGPIAVVMTTVPRRLRTPKRL